MTSKGSPERRKWSQQLVKWNEKASKVRQKAINKEKEHNVQERSLQGCQLAFRIYVDKLGAIDLGAKTDAQTHQESIPKQVSNKS